MNIFQLNPRWIVVLLLLVISALIFVVVPYLKRRIAIHRCRKLAEKILTGDPVSGDCSALEHYFQIDQLAKEHKIQSHHIHLAAMYHLAHWAYHLFCLYIRWWKQQQDLNVMDKNERMQFSIMLFSLRVQADAFSRKWLKRPHDEMLE